MPAGQAVATQRKGCQLPVCTALPWRLLAALAVGRGAGAGLGSHRRPCTGNFWSVLAWRGQSLWLPPSRLPPPLPALRPRQTPSRVRARSLNVRENALMWAASASWGRVPGAAVVLPLAPAVRPLSCAPGEASAKDSISGAAGLSGLAGGAPSPVTEAARVAGGRGDMAGLCREAPPPTPVSELVEKVLKTQSHT